MTRLHLQDAGDGLWKAEGEEEYFVELDHPYDGYSHDLLVANCNSEGERLKYPQFWGIVRIHPTDFRAASLLLLFSPTKKCRNAEDTGRNIGRRKDMMGLHDTYDNEDAGPVIHRYVGRDRTQTHRSDFRLIHAGYP